MNLELVSLNQEQSLQVTEWAWAPLRSMLAIANRIEQEETGDLCVSYEQLKDLQENIGEGITDGDSCKRLAGRLKDLACDPMRLLAYGMTADMEDGLFFYTYPSEFCTAAMEHCQSKIIVDFKDRVDPESTRSMLRASEKDLAELIDFLENCGGFLMP